MRCHAHYQLHHSSIGSKVLLEQSIVLLTTAGESTHISPTGIGEITMPSSLVKIKYLVSYICDIFWSLLLCLAQIVCDLKGQIIVMHLGMGHNNDQGMFNLTMFKNGWEKMAFTCSQTVDTMIIG